MQKCRLSASSKSTYKNPKYNKTVAIRIRFNKFRRTSILAITAYSNRCIRFCYLLQVMIRHAINLHLFHGINEPRTNHQSSPFIVNERSILNLFIESQNISDFVGMITYYSPNIHRFFIIYSLLHMCIHM